MYGGSGGFFYSNVIVDVMCVLCIVFVERISAVIQKCHSIRKNHINSKRISCDDCQIPCGTYTLPSRHTRHISSKESNSKEEEEEGKNGKEKNEIILYRFQNHIIFSFSNW